MLKAIGRKQMWVLGGMKRQQIRRGFYFGENDLQNAVG